MAFDRNKGIGGTDARRIMAGDWHPLWMEKTGRRPAPPLTDIFRVQLGLVTENFHLDWIQKRQEILIIDRQEILEQGWQYITIDGRDHETNVHVEVKHSHGDARVRDSAEYYMAQLQHGMQVLGTDWCWFSVIPGNEEPLTVKVERDQDYIDRLWDLEKQFWWHVTEDVAPEILPSTKLEEAKAQVKNILVDGLTAPKDMSQSNEWAELAHQYIEMKPIADRCKVVNDELKKLIHPTWGGAFGHGVTVSRTKKGLTLRINGETDG